MTLQVGDNKLWEVFQRRVVEHNIRVLAKYYTRISLQRFTQLLDLDLKVRDIKYDLISERE